MKRIYKLPEEPRYLERYRIKYPNENWEHFRRYSPKGYEEIKERLLTEQHCLCAYCEIDIKQTEEDGVVDDFRVEHFYPKKGTEDGEHNYHLDWQNMLGVCHGGSQALVVEPERRFTKAKTEHSCDVPKSDKAISDKILNPLEITMEKRIFHYSSKGKMFVDDKYCPEELKEKAENTIKELNLNSVRLQRLRREVIQKVQDELFKLTADPELTPEELDAIELDLAYVWLTPNAEGKYLPFFSAIRSVLNEGAEQYLAEQGYIV